MPVSQRIGIDQNLGVEVFIRFDRYVYHRDLRTKRTTYVGVLNERLIEKMGYSDEIKQKLREILERLRHEEEERKKAIANELLNRIIEALELCNDCKARIESKREEYVRRIMSIVSIT